MWAALVSITAYVSVQAQEAEEMRRITEAALATPKGRKKDFGTEMPKGYVPTYVEAAMCARPESLH